MRTKSVSVILALAVWLLISPGLLFAQQDSLPGGPLFLKQGASAVPPSSPSDTVITVTKLPYPEARSFLQRQRPGGPPLVARGAAKAQSAVRNPSLSFQSSSTELEACIHQRHQLQLTANLTTLQESKKGAWLKYLPSVSLASGFRASPDSPFGGGGGLSIGLNSSLIYTAHRDKQQRAATRDAIIQRAQLQEDQEIAKLHRLQRRLQIETDKLNLHVGVTDIDRQLFNLYQQQYDNHDISPEEYLLKRKAFLLQELRNQDQLNRIEALQYEIEDLAGCLIPPLGTGGASRK